MRQVKAGRNTGRRNLQLRRPGHEPEAIMTDGILVDDSSMKSTGWRKPAPATRPVIYTCENAGENTFP